MGIGTEYAWVRQGAREIVDRTQAQTLITENIQSEEDIMMDMGYVKLYDCGKIVLKYK